jgi:hypothetical protein
MNSQNNDHPENIHCGFCGYEIEWGYTACRGCGATVTYGLEATRGVWHALYIVSTYLVVFAGFCVTTIAFIASINIINDTGFRFMNASVLWSLLAVVSFCGGWYGFCVLIGKLTELVVQKTGIDRQWRNKYVFYRAVS